MKKIVVIIGGLIATVFSAAYSNFVFEVDLEYSGENLLKKKDNERRLTVSDLK